MGKHFLWDPVEDNIVKELGDAGSAVADYTTEPYLYGDLISQHRGGQASFFHYDGQGSTMALTDAGANVIDTYAYSAFGEATAQTGNTVNPFQYVGRKGYYWDRSTGDYEVRWRVLSATEQRWLTADPSEVVDSYNLYAYVHNRPSNLTDPMGLGQFGPIDLFGCCCCCVGGVEAVLNRTWDSKTYFGHVIDITLSVWYMGPHMFDDCSFEWWEKMNIPPTDQPQYKRNKWLLVNDAAANPHPLEYNWNMRQRICDTGEAAKESDYAYLEKDGTGVRELFIKLIVKSGKSCFPSVCKEKERSKCIYQRLKVDKGKPDLDPNETYLRIIPDVNCSLWNPYVDKPSLPKK